MFRAQERIINGYNADESRRDLVVVTNFQGPLSTAEKIVFKTYGPDETLGIPVTVELICDNNSASYTKQTRYELEQPTRPDATICDYYWDIRRHFPGIKERDIAGTIFTGPFLSEDRKRMLNLSAAEQRRQDLQQKRMTPEKVAVSVVGSVAYAIYAAGRTVWEEFILDPKN